MLNPISLNVVRQSLAWMGLPPVVRMSNVAPVVNEHGPLALMTLIHFAPDDIMKMFGFTHLIDGMELGALTALVNECFCDDIHAVASYYSAGANLIRVKLVMLPFVAEIF